MQTPDVVTGEEAVDDKDGGYKPDWKMATRNTFIHFDPYASDEELRENSLSPRRELHKNSLSQRFPPHKTKLNVWPPKMDWGKDSKKLGGLVVLRDAKTKDDLESRYRMTLKDLAMTCKKGKTWARQAALDFSYSEDSSENRSEGSSEESEKTIHYVATQVRPSAFANSDSKENMGGSMQKTQKTSLGWAIFMAWNELREERDSIEGRSQQHFNTNVWCDFELPKSHPHFEPCAFEQQVYFCLYYIGCKMPEDNRLRIISVPQRAPILEKMCKHFGHIKWDSARLKRDSEMVSILLTKGECIALKERYMQKTMRPACYSMKSSDKEGVGCLLDARHRNSSLLWFQDVVEIGNLGKYGLGIGPHTGTPFHFHFNYLKSVPTYKNAPLYYIFSDLATLMQDPGAEELKDRILTTFPAKSEHKDKGDKIELFKRGDEKKWIWYCVLIQKVVLQVR